jgi:Poly(hydroxyalcanoate) granule associated protein (phasin)
MATKASSKTGAKPASKTAHAKSSSSEPLHKTASNDMWLAGLGAMAQAQAVAQEKLHEATAHFNQLAQGLTSGINSNLVQPAGIKVDRLEHLFEDRVARALKSLGLPTAQEVADLQDRVAALEAALKASASRTSNAVPRKRTSSRTGSNTSAKSTATKARK